METSTHGNVSVAVVREFASDVVIAGRIWEWASPVLLLVGLVGNVLALLVLLRPALRRSSTFCLLAALAVSDTLVLLTGLLRDWLSILGTSFRAFNATPWLCGPVTVLSSAAMYCSSWLVVAVAVDRYMAVCRPIQARSYRTPRRAAAITAAVALLALALGLVWLLVGGLGKCFTPPGSALEVWLDQALYTLLPATAILTLNVFTLHSMFHRLSRRRSLRRLRRQSSQPPPSCLPDTPECRATQEKVRLGCVTLTVSLTYLLTTLPNSALLLAGEVQGEELQERLFLVQTVTMLLWYSNHAFNFYLYCLTAQQVRLQLADLCRPCQRQRQAVAL